MVIGHLIIVRVFDEGLARKVTERFEIVLAVMEDSCVALQSLHGDSAAAGGLHCHLNGPRAVRLVGTVAAVVKAIAQANFVDAHGIAADNKRVNLCHVADGTWHKEIWRQQPTECKGVLLKDGDHAVQRLDADVVTVTNTAKWPTTEVERWPSELVLVSLRHAVIVH